MDFYQVAHQLHWSWADWEDTPLIVRQLTWTYLQAQAEEAADTARAGR